MEWLIGVLVVLCICSVMVLVSPTHMVLCKSYNEILKRVCSVVAILTFIVLAILTYN